MTQRRYDETGRHMIRKYLGPCVSIADFGCAGQKIRHDAVGYDRDPEAGPDVLMDLNYLSIIESGLFDGICMSHFLEHIVDLRRCLKNCRRILRIGGRIAVCVPHGEQTCPETLGDATDTHENLFTPKTLKLHLMHAGFVDVHAEAYDRPTAYKQTQGVFARGERAE